MRRIVALSLLAGAAALTATPALAQSCYGVRGAATVCFDGNPVPTVGTWNECVYTGGSTCENVPVPGPVWEGPIDFSPTVCILGQLPAQCYYP